VSVVFGSILSGYGGIVGDGFVATARVGGFVMGTLGLPVHEEIAGLVLLVALISFVWGVAYHYARHGDGSEPSRF